MVDPKIVREWLAKAESDLHSQQTLQVFTQQKKMLSGPKMQPKE